MLARSLVNEIIEFSLEDRISLLEKTIISIKEELPMKRTLADAALLIESEYKANKELTSFTSLDFEDFYEVR